MTTGDKQQEFDTFFLSFAGQPVIITTNLSSESIPIFYEGILLDYDENYYYLGQNPNEISQAIKITNAAHIMVADDKMLFDEILNQMPDGEVN